MKSSVQTLSTQGVFNKAFPPPGIWENPRGISNTQASPGPWGQHGHGLGLTEHFRWGGPGEFWQPELAVPHQHPM